MDRTDDTTHIVNSVFNDGVLVKQIWFGFNAEGGSLSEFNAEGCL